MAEYNLQDYQDPSDPELKKYLAFLKEQQAKAIPAAGQPVGDMEQDVVDKFDPIGKLINPKPNASFIQSLIPGIDYKKPEPIPQPEMVQGPVIGTKAGEIAGTEIPDTVDRKTAGIPSSTPPVLAKPTSIMDFLDFGQNNLSNKEGLQAAIDERNNRQMIANIGAAANTFSGGLARTGPVDNSAFDKLSKQAEQSVTDYEKQVEFQKQDPNSSYSKGLKDYFKSKLGIEVRGDASAVDLEKIMPFAVREYEAKEARAARKQEMDENRRQRAEDQRENRELRKVLGQQKADSSEETAEGRAKDKLTTNTRLIRKEIMSGPSGKAYNNYLNADRAVKSIQQFMTDPTGYSDYGSLMLGLKALQGDDSVVREAEIRMGMNAASLQDKVLNRIQQLRNGKALQKGQREDILKAVSSLSDITKGQFLQAASPQLKQADELGIPREQLIDTLLEQPSTRELQGKQVVKQGYNSKTNQTQLIYSDGTKEIVDGRR